VVRGTWVIISTEEISKVNKAVWSHNGD